MIYSGYPGVGKSTIAGKYNCIDLESSNFGKELGWEKVYCQVAKDLSDQGYNAFVSTHAAVRKQLDEMSVNWIAVIPSLELKDEWLEKLEKRTDEKHIRAFKWVKEHYEEDVREIMNTKREHILLHRGYKLEDILKEKGEYISQ